jgi:hypothetical protein
MSRFSLQSGIIFRTHVEDKLVLVAVQAGSSSLRQLNLEVTSDRGAPSRHPLHRTQSL